MVMLPEQDDKQTFNGNKLTGSLFENVDSSSILLHAAAVSLLTHSSNGFDPLSLSEFYSNVFEDMMDVITRLLEVILLHITAHKHTIADSHIHFKVKKAHS